VGAPFVTDYASKGEPMQDADHKPAVKLTLMAPTKARVGSFNTVVPAGGSLGSNRDDVMLRPLQRLMVVTSTIVLFITSVSVGAWAPHVWAQMAPAIPATMPSPDVVRIARILNVTPQVSLLLVSPKPKLAPPISENQDMLDQMQALSRMQVQAAASTSELLANQELLAARNTVNAAAVQAMTDITHAFMVIQRKTRTIQIAKEERAYRNTKFFNAFLGTTIGMVGSGLQFSKSQTVNYVGDGISVAGGAVTAAFNLCTADVDVRDTVRDL
jgi:hypothetical protein